MIRVRILKGLDIAPSDAEVYLTLTVDGISKTSKPTVREKPEDAPSPAASPAPVETPVEPSLKREPSTKLKQLGWVWDEDLDLTLAQSTKKDSAEIEVCCFDAHRQCGKVKIPLARLAPNEAIQQWYPLAETSNPKAAVQLKMTYISEVPNARITGSPNKLKNRKSAPTENGSTQGSKEKLEENLSIDTPLNIPMGLADYFVVAGCPQETARQERLRMLAAKTRKKQPFHQHNSGPVDELSQAFVVGPESVTLSPVLIDRYPQTDREEVEFPTKLEMFLMPDGAEIVRTVPTSARKPRFFTCVLLTNGIRTFGFCLEAFEPLPRMNKATDYEDLYSPIVFCYVTRVPLPIDTWKYVLSQTYQARRRNMYERVVQAVVRSIPTPLPGLFGVKYDLLSHERSSVSLPPATDLPALVFPSMSSHLFSWFPLDAIIDLWTAALTEQRIMVHSQNREVLAIITETIIQLMYPFKWENAYLPLLPTSLMQMVDSPIPAILGVRTDAIKLIHGGLETMTDWIIVDADKCMVHYAKHEPLPALPVDLRARLFRTVRQVLTNRATTQEKKDREIRLAFIECLASMLQGYRECFFVLATDADASTVFNKSQFFQRQASQKQQQIAQTNSHVSLPGSAQMGDGGLQFLDMFFNTTAFERFKVSQYDPETDFFHAVYGARRSKERERDQRTAALVTIQSEVEMTAAQQQYSVGGAVQSSNGQLTAPQTAVGPITATVVKLWSARETRWSPVALDPIDPASGTENRRRPVIVEAVSPIKVGEEVECGVFGRGVVVAPPRGGIVEVKMMSWGATGFFLIDNVTVPQAGSPLKIHQSPKLEPSSNTSSSPQSKEASLSEDEGDDDEMGISAPSYPIKTIPERYDKDPLTLVDGAFLTSIMNSDPKAVRKSLAHLRRIMGLSGDEEQKSRTASNPRPMKSATDMKMERAMQRAITNVFQDRPVPENDLRECGNNLANSQYARDMLIYVLKSQQSNHNATGTSGNWLATPGRGRRLGPDAFESLAELFDSLLKACAAKEDYTNGRCALEVAQFYYCEEETLQTKLKRHLLWSKPVFWEYAFAEQFALSLDATKAVPEQPTLGSDQSMIEPPALAMARFHDIGKTCPPGEEEARKQKLFEHLSFFLHTMLNLDVSEEMARVFVDRMASVYALDEDQKLTLNMLITNISRAALYNNEEERAMQSQNEDSQPGSPNGSSSSKRHLRKHYSVEQMTNSAFARLTNWRRGSKARSPNSGVVGRRDSQTSQETG